MDKMAQGQQMIVQASDFGFHADIEAWAKNTGNTIVDNQIKDGKVVATVAKGNLNLDLLPEEGKLIEGKKWGDYGSL